MKFTWYGKENAIIESMTPSTGTLRPDKESSKNWDDTENLYIEGDNLEVLKMLQENDCGEKAIAGVTGMIEGCENVLEGLKNVK